MGYLYNVTVFYVIKGEKVVRHWDTQLKWKKGNHTFAWLDAQAEENAKILFRTGRYFDNRDYAIIGVKVRRKFVCRLKKKEK